MVKIFENNKINIENVIFPILWFLAVFFTFLKTKNWWDGDILKPFKKMHITFSSFSST